jgi:hypothetical protein
MENELEEIEFFTFFSLLLTSINRENEGVRDTKKILLDRKRKKSKVFKRFLGGCANCKTINRSKEKNWNEFFALTRTMVIHLQNCGIRHFNRFNLFLFSI